ncbi:MAG: glycosyltransferase [Magnetococcales bacterium]|nr:glycosyltransferase [Magnetococcales bacterium]
MRVALLVDGFLAWGGGVDFFRGILTALAAKAVTEKLTLFLLVPQNTLAQTMDATPNRYRKIIFDKLAGKQACLHTPLANVADCVDLVLYPNDYPSLVACLHQVKADVVIPSFFLLGPDFRWPWAGYIYDFQYKYYPEFFSPSLLRHREEEFALRVNQPKAVLAHSCATRQDADRFFPHHAARIFALPPTPILPEPWLAEPTENITEKYHLPARYFVISNQFWVHKAHLTAFDALSRFHRLTSQTDVQIVCTGKTDDDRFPDYFAQLQQQVREISLQDKILFLGHIPKFDQIQILKGAIAVLQPTLFEGMPGGGSGCDAVALGQCAIVSDIPVNREMEEDNIYFFKVKSAEDMAEKMVQVFLLSRPQKTKEELIRHTHIRIERLGDTLLEVIRFLTKE